MIFSRALPLLALPLLAVATAIQGRGGSPTTSSPASTPTSGAQCCASTGSTSDPAFVKELGLLGVIVEGVDVLVGLTCSPITVVGVGSGESCSGTTVTCTDNQFLPLVGIGCVPITL
ncbi:fungal hydrophobin-domain-containing protein [Cerioporus squamosus]|nr:fungal hydrophobin-domain-containing protein [Cerioporus squamosus]